MKRKDYILKELKPDYVHIRISNKLNKKIDKFAERLELPRSETIRLILDDTIKKFTYIGKDELYCPYWDEMSEILAILKNIQLREKLENMPDGMKTDEINEWILKNIIFGEQIN